jgi:hypothetical protein
MIPTAPIALPCPLCRAGVHHVADDRHRCDGCGRTLRMVPGGKLVPYVRLPWEPKPPDTG